MSEIISTKSIGRGFVDIKEDFILIEEPMSRIVFQAQIHSKGIRGHVIRQRRESNDDIWISDKAIDIRTLGKNESIHLELRTEATKNLYIALTQLISILTERGIEYGSNTYAVVDPNKVIITDENKIEYIKKILDAGYTEELLNSLVEANPPLITKMSYAKIISDRKIVLEQFETYLNETRTEQEWQKFFKDNQWIFGYGLNYQFLNLITDQPTYAGADYTGIGEQRGDYLMNTEAKNKFTVLVEIKKPQSLLVQNEEYRNGAWKLNNELMWAVSQVQINCSSWFRDGSRRDAARDDLEGEDIYTYDPKGILVMGLTRQLDNRKKIQTFEAYRRNLHNPEIITFDELYERAKFIVEHNEDIS